MAGPSVRRSGTPVWPAIAAAPFAAAAAWIAYSRFAIDHHRHMPPALPGDRVDVATEPGRVSLYVSDTTDGVPLLLVHSINAAASAYEVRPLYMHYRRTRPVYAIDLPGFGFSERADLVHTPRVMVDALHAATAMIRRRHGGQAVDCVALSLSCEYAARAALERPDDYRSLGLISPTGFDKALAGAGPAQSTKGSRFRYDLVSRKFWSRALFDLVVSKPSMRFFLEKTWGSKRIDEGLFAYCQLTAHQPGAEYVVWSFLSGFLFADDITRIYKLLQLPIWTCHGMRGDFVDFRKEAEIAARPNWHFAEYDTGAFPQFEALGALTQDYDAFTRRLRA